jgi:hypothetical protein
MWELSSGASRGSGTGQRGRASRGIVWRSISRHIPLRVPDPTKTTFEITIC